MKNTKFDEQEVIKNLKLEAKALRIPDGAAESFIKLTMQAVKKTLKDRKIITDGDLTRIIVKELKKYNDDFAYVYQNRDKII